MSSRLKSSDHPELWFSKRKTKEQATRQKKHVTTLAAIKDNSHENALKQCPQRGRQRNEAEAREIDSLKRRKSGKAVCASPSDTSLRIPENAVADVEELQRKRERDVAACGRTMRTILTTVKQKIVSHGACNESGDGERYHTAERVLPSGGCPSSPKTTPTQTWTG